MWEATARAERSAVVAAAPEAVWALARSPRAWSARPGGCLSFELAEGLRFLISAAGDHAAATVLEVTDERPGQLIVLEVPSRRASWTLEVSEANGGARLRIAEAQQVSRPAKIDAEVMIEDEVKAWLAALRAIAEGREPWPAEGVPEGLRQAFLGPAAATPGVEVSASTHVNAAPERVARALISADVVRAVQSAEVPYYGDLPGTPAGQVGGVRYFVYRIPSGQLVAVATLIAASSPGALMTRQVTAPFGETTYRYEQSSEGTELSISWRVPGAAPRDAQDRWPERLGDGVAELARRYKAVIESLDADG